MGQVEALAARSCAELDGRFHEIYVDTGAGARLTSLYDAVKPQVERYVRFYVHALIDQMHTSVGEHDEIIDSVERGDPEEAEWAVQANWRNAASRLRSVMDRTGEFGSW